ncbi:MAG: hypothetical protein V7L23_15220 [Nostoc sp.]|uniref:beta strand repeat-containing protein n=1 Tax=Nostoc sp. TaxID=1180 RepID=UPI002FEFD80F
MTTIEATFKDSAKQPISGYLEAIPENSDGIIGENSTIFISKKTQPIKLLFGSATLDLLPGQYIFALTDDSGLNSTSFSANIPDTSDVVLLSDLISSEFGGGKFASADEAGVIRVGSGLDIDQDGVLYVTDIEVNTAIANRLGTLTETILFVNAKANPINDAFDNNGQSQFKPYRSIERALAEAALATEPVTIMVAPGNYLVDNRPGKSTADLVAFQSDPAKMAEILTPPVHYGRYQDASNLIKSNQAWLVQQAFAAVTQQLAADSVTLTLEQSKLCKRDLGLIVKGLINDLSEMGNKWTICSARTYRNPAMQLRYVTTAQTNSLKFGLENLRINAIKALTNQAPITDTIIPGDSVSRIKNNSCSDVQSTLNTLITLIKTSLDGSTNPWKIDIRRGVFPHLHYLNPPKVVLDANANETNLATYQLYRDAATLINLNRDALIAAAYASISSQVVTGKQVKCQRDIGYILDAIVADTRRQANFNTLSAAKFYKDISGNYFENSDGSYVILPAERTLMNAALANLGTNIALAITNSFGDPTLFSPTPGNYTPIQASVATLIAIIQNTLTSNAYNPWTDTPPNKGVTILSGGILVPNGTTFIASGLRQPIIQPLYIAEEDLDYETDVPIFKLTAKAFSYGFTYFDTPGANSSHHKVWAAMFGNDDFELNPASSAYYWAKIGVLFYSNVSYFPDQDNLDTESETVIGAPADAGDASVVDATKSASPYIYNCSVRSVYGLNGMLADGARVSGFRSMVTAQFTQVSLQRDKNAWQKWDATTQSWVGLALLDDFTTMKPALFVDYIQGISEATLKPVDQAIRINPRYRHTGFKGTNNAFVQIVSCFGIGLAQSYSVETGADFSITNSNTNFGEIALVASGFRQNAFFVDSGFNWAQIIPPVPLTSKDIVSYEFSQFNAARTITYYQSSGLRDRIYLVNGIQLPSVFTLFPGGKAYLFNDGNEYALDLVQATGGTVGNAYDVDTDGTFYIQVNPDTNTVFTTLTTLNDLTLLDGSRLSIKRVVDQRSTDQKVYRFVVTAPDAIKRIPPPGFVINTGTEVLTNSGKIFFVYKSETYGILTNNQFVITLLGLNGDGTSEQASSLVPLQQSDYNLDPVVDIASGNITTPDYNPVTSLTRQIAELIIDTANLGYTPDGMDWANPSTAAVNIINTGAGDGTQQTLQFHRPSQIRCSGHTFEYVGYPQYSQGFPQFQQIVIPTSFQLYKNRKNILGGIVYYDGLDDKGNNWVGDTLTNIATGAETNLTVVDVPPPAVPASFDTLEIATRIIVGGSLEIDYNAVIIPTSGYLKIANIRQFVASAPPTSGIYSIGDIVLNSAPTEGSPYGWRCIANNPASVWEIIAGDIFKNLTVTHAFDIPLASVASIEGTLNTSGATNLSGVVTVNGASAALSPTALTATPAILAIAPTSTTTASTIDNVLLGSITPKPIVGTTITSTGNAVLASATVTTTLGVTGASTLASVGVTGNASVGGTLGVTGVSTLASVGIGTTLSVSGLSTLNSLAVTGATNLSGTLSVAGASTLASAGVTGNATVGGTLGVTGLTTLAVAAVTTNATIGGTLGVTGLTTLASASITNNLAVNGIATIGTANITGNETVTGTLGVTGLTTLASATVTNTLTTNAHTANGVSTFNGNITASNATAITTLGSLKVVVAPTGTDSTIDNVTIGGTTPRPVTATTLNTTGLATLNNLSVPGSGTIAGSLTVNGTLTVNGPNIINTTINSTTSDPVLDIGGGTAGAALTNNDGNDRGLLLHYYTTQEYKAFVGWSSATGYLTYYSAAATVTGNENKINTATATLGDIQAGNFRGNLVGNAQTATALATPRNIGGIAFNGTADVVLTTSNIPEGSNLYHTDARTRAAISSGTTSLSYNQSTGAFTIPSINGIAIGGTTPAAIAATTLTTTGTANLNTLAVTAGATAATIATSGLATLNSLAVTAGSSLNTLTTSGLATLNSLTVSNGTSLNTLTTSGLATLNSLTVSGAATIGGSAILTNSLVGAANGLATLDGTSLVPNAQLPTNIARLNVSQQYTAAQGSGIQTVTYATSITLDLSQSNSFVITLTGNITSLDCSNLRPGTYLVTFIQSAGSNTLSGWATKFKFPGGTLPTLSIGAAAVDILTMVCDGTVLRCIMSNDFR